MTCAEEKPKEEPKKELKEELKLDPKVDLKEELKVDPKVDIKEELNVDPKVEIKEELKVDPKVELKEELKDQGNGEKEPKENGGAVVENAAPQAGAIVPATGPRPDRVTLSSLIYLVPRLLVHTQPLLGSYYQDVDQLIFNNYCSI